MGVVVEEVRFAGSAPDVRLIATAITELCGLPVLATESPAEVKGVLCELHAHLAFSCAPRDEIEVYAYRPGAVRQFYDDARG